MLCLVWSNDGSEKYFSKSEKCRDYAQKLYGWYACPTCSVCVWPAYLKLWKNVIINDKFKYEWKIYAKIFHYHVITNICSAPNRIIANCNEMNAFNSTMGQILNRCKNAYSD